MRAETSEKLLAKVIDFSAEEFSQEIPKIDALAEFKYDEYQRFHPGMKFMESFASWLFQFKQCDRRTAFQFVRDRLVFVSRREMMHLVHIAYPDYIRPVLLRRAADESNLKPYLLGRIANTPEFNSHLTQTLFLGLTDGAHTDWLRRSNPELNHEQVRMSYEITEDRANDLREFVDTNQSSIRKGNAEHCFRNLVLLDDFTGSGTSLIRESNGTLKGKLPRMSESLKQGVLKDLFDIDDTVIQFVPYVATDRALNHIKSEVRKLGGPWANRFELNPILRLDNQCVVSSAKGVGKLIEKYYDHSVHDYHMRKGGTKDSRWGYAGCSLTVVLFHNTPNNSIYLLWAPEDKEYFGLFPRISRHKDIRRADND